MAKIVVGIDPDVQKSGVSIFDIENREVSVYAYTFAECIARLNELKAEYGDVEVFVEGGWLNEKSNFHKVFGRAGERIAKNVGANHQVGKLLIEMCEYNKIKVEAVKPLKKHWKGKDGKITNGELQYILKFEKWEMKTKEMNQDKRDSVLIGLSRI